MFLLPGDVFAHGFNLRKADGENPVAVLPREIRKVGRFGFQPQRRTAFDFLNHRRHVTRARQGAEQMHMIFHTANDDGLAFEIGQDAAEVTMQFVTQRFVAEERPPNFGGKDRVHQDFGEGLRHNGMMPNAAVGFNPFRVD